MNDLIGFKTNNWTILSILDRIDSSKGYIENNIQWIHKDLQFMKNTMSDNKFIKYCQLVADKSRGAI